MYGRGVSVSEIRGHLEELYGIDDSSDLTSAATDAVFVSIIRRTAAERCNRSCARVCQIYVEAYPACLR